MRRKAGLAAALGAPLVAMALGRGWHWSLAPALALGALCLGALALRRPDAPAARWAAGAVLFACVAAPLRGGAQEPSALLPAGLLLVAALLLAPAGKSQIPRSLRIAFWLSFAWLTAVCALVPTIEASRAVPRPDLGLSAILLLGSGAAAALLASRPVAIATRPSLLLLGAVLLATLIPEGARALEARSLIARGGLAQAAELVRDRSPWRGARLALDAVIEAGGPIPDELLHHPAVDGRAHAELLGRLSPPEAQWHAVDLLQGDRPRARRFEAAAQGDARLTEALAYVRGDRPARLASATLRSHASIPPGGHTVIDLRWERSRPPWSPQSTCAFLRRAGQSYESRAPGLAGELELSIPAAAPTGLYRVEVGLCGSAPGSRGELAARPLASLAVQRPPQPSGLSPADLERLPPHNWRGGGGFAGPGVGLVLPLDLPSSPQLTVLHALIASADVQDGTDVAELLVYAGEEELGRARLVAGVDTADVWRAFPGRNFRHGEPTAAVVHARSHGGIAFETRLYATEIPLSPPGSRPDRLEVRHLAPRGELHLVDVGAPHP